VNPGPASLRDRLERVKERIRRAAERAGRAADAVRLVGVVKNVSDSAVAEAVALGLTDLGENRVQEAQARIARIGRDAARWHLIGHLQRNKAGRAAELFDRIHSLDTPELASALSARIAGSRESGGGRARGTGVESGAAERRLPVLVEVNIAGEPTKHGVGPEGATALVEAVAVLPGLALDGLMAVGPAVREPEEARAGFALLRRLRDAIEGTTGLSLPELSMGMSGDFEAAIAEGATMVRVGTALFGPRA
jgi:PLP dependent protein